MSSNNQMDKYFAAMFVPVNKGFPQIRSDGSYSSGLPSMNANMYEGIRKGLKKRLLYYTMVNTFIEASPKRKKNRDLLLNAMEWLPYVSIIPTLHKLIITSQVNPKKFDSTWKEEMILGSLGFIGGKGIKLVWEKGSKFLLPKIKNLYTQKKIKIVGDHLSEKAGEDLSEVMYKFLQKMFNPTGLKGIEEPQKNNIRKFAAIGIPRVPYDNYPALLHEGESVLTKRETNNMHSGFGSVSIAKLSDTIIVREDADIDRIANTLVSKIKMTALNMA
jgi:hypothetical protein